MVKARVSPGCQFTQRSVDSHLAVMHICATFVFGCNWLHTYSDCICATVLSNILCPQGRIYTPICTVNVSLWCKSSYLTLLRQMYNVLLCRWRLAMTEISMHQQYESVFIMFLHPTNDWGWFDEAIFALCEPEDYYYERQKQQISIRCDFETRCAHTCFALHMASETSVANQLRACDCDE